jgi:hypothetical protein
MPLTDAVVTAVVRLSPGEHGRDWGQQDRYFSGLYVGPPAPLPRAIGGMPG